MSIKKPESWEYWEFENSKKRKLLPSGLVLKVSDDLGREKRDKFLLTLALIFNDIKGLILIHDTISQVYRRGERDELSEHVGEREGIRRQLLKYLIGTLHEFMYYLKKNASKDVYDSNYIQRLLCGVSQEARDTWCTISAKGGNAEKGGDEFVDFCKIVGTIRGNIAFHYQYENREEGLMSGYRKFFFDEESVFSESAKESAFRSVKANDVMDTRYYYADAAVFGYLNEIFGEGELGEERMNCIFNYGGKFLRAINELLIEHHKLLPNN